MIIKFSKAAFVLHPIAAIKYITGNKNAVHDLVVIKTAKFFLGKDFKKTEIKRYLEEIYSNDHIPMNPAPEGVKMHGNRPAQLFGKWLYVMVRAFKPEVMIETGVAHGVSSWSILNAMEKNKKGKLYSIDLPNVVVKKDYEIKRFDKESGWVVPDILRHRWELHIGPSEKLLPELGNRLKAIDIFFHDSGHSYENMKFEFDTAARFLKPGGLIVSDDVHKNSAFSEFVASHNLRAIMFSSKGAVASKEIS